MARRADMLLDDDASLQGALSALEDGPASPRGAAAPDARADLLDEGAAARGASSAADAMLDALGSQGAAEAATLSARSRRRVERAAEEAAEGSRPDEEGPLPASARARAAAAGIAGAAAAAAAAAASVDRTARAAGGEASDVDDEASERGRRLAGRAGSRAASGAASRVRAVLRREKIRDGMGRTQARAAAGRARTASAPRAAMRRRAVRRGSPASPAKAARGLGCGGAIAAAAAALLALTVLLALLAMVWQSFNGSLEGLSPTEQQVARFLLSKGCDEVHVAAIMANMRAESAGEVGDDFDAGSVEGNGVGHGICQWSYERWNGYTPDGVYTGPDNLLEFAQSQGREWTDLGVQLDFFWQEFDREWGRGPYLIVDPRSDDPPAGTRVPGGSHAGFDAATSVEDATLAFCYGFEAPGIPHESRRLAFARQYLAILRHGGASAGYVQAALEMAADDSIGYSQARRTLNPDVDCSSFVYYALLRSGWTADQLGGEYPFTTYNMGEILVGAGFSEHAYAGESELREGDILVRHNAYGDHTEIYLGDGERVGAHSDYDGKPGDSLGIEVDVSPFGSATWDYYYRAA